MQNPNIAPDITNLWFLRRFFCKIVMLVAANAMKMAMNTALIGTSGVIEGSSPRLAVVEAYGPDRDCNDENIVATVGIGDEFDMAFST